MAQDIAEVRSKSVLLRGQTHDQIKHHTVRDAVGRPQFIFSTKVDAVEGDPCLCTEYVYKDATTYDIMDTQERVYKWKAAWDGNFTFDPSVDYDADGDGVL